MTRAYVVHSTDEVSESARGTTPLAAFYARGPGSDARPGLVEDDAAEALAGFEDVDGLHGLVDALERVRDEVVDGQLAREVLVDEARDVRACGCTVYGVLAH